MCPVPVWHSPSLSRFSLSLRLPRPHWHCRRGGPGGLAFTLVASAWAPAVALGVAQADCSLPLCRASQPAYEHVQSGGAGHRVEPRESTVQQPTHPATGHPTAHGCSSLTGAAHVSQRQARVAGWGVWLISEQLPNGFQLDGILHKHRAASVAVTTSAPVDIASSTRHWAASPCATCA